MGGSRLSTMWLSTLLAVVTYSMVFAQEKLTYETIIHNELNISISDFQLPWAEAVTACEARDQKLASVESAEKDDIFVQLFLEHGNVTLKGNSWVSATEVREGVWHWESLDKPIYHTRWFVGQPDDTENLNCVYLASTALLYWRDANCSASMYYICESQANKDDSESESSGFSFMQNNSSLFALSCVLNSFLVISRFS